MLRYKRRKTDTTAPTPVPYQPNTSPQDRESLQQIARLTFRREWLDLMTRVLNDLERAEMAIKDNQ